MGRDKLVWRLWGILLLEAPFVLSIVVSYSSGTRRRPGRKKGDLFIPPGRMLLLAAEGGERMDGQGLLWNAYTQTSM